MNTTEGLTMAPTSRASTNNLTINESLSNTSLPHPALSCSIDESYKYIFLPICYSFTFIFSICLNSVVLYRSFQRTKQWNASLIYMVNLASTDFMYGLSLPFLIASYIMRDCWVFGDFMCRLVRFLFYFNLYCSIFFLTCISVHRYLGICHPMRTITMENRRAVKWTCVLVWVVVFAFTCPIFRFAQTGLATRLAGSSSDASSVGEVDLQLSRNNKSRHDDWEGMFEEFQNCWDDAIDKEFSDYVPYGIILHLFGFFLPFSIIAWCYSHVVLTIFRTLHSQPLSPRGQRKSEEGNGAGTDGGRGQKEISEMANTRAGGFRSDNGISVFLGAHSPYTRRRRKSIKTIVTITLLFALCFFPFHVTRTIFLILKVTKGVPCQTMAVVSMCYKITRPLASFNAWLNALLYFLTKEKIGGHCCQAESNNGQHHGGFFWPLKLMGKAEDVEEGRMGEAIDEKGNKEVNNTQVYIHD